ncbi:tyrosine-type recombinase/integrase, partial [Escherichia coli]|uniref:tyrosine-type recombinase/integrase n=1 Tax=Escherichia coli TaxID=562 RepID=UPI00190BEA6E
ALSFELVQRVSDCFGFEDPADADSDGDAVRDERGIRWSDYQCKKSIVVRQHKTKKRLVIPLVDNRFSPPISLYPELEEGLEQAYELGADGLIVVEERNGKPYKPRRMSSVHRKICEAAGLPKKLTFTSFRHGGATELGDAGETDIRSISGHTQIDTSLIYNKASQQKAREIASRRREYVRLISNTAEAQEDND